jgi:hypothetical protein
MQKAAIKINLQQLEQMLLNENGGSAFFGGLTILTAPRLNKRGNPLAGQKVKKKTTMTVLGRLSYSNAVNNQREREGLDTNFEAQPLWKGWGERVNGLGNALLARHKGNGQLYLAVMPHRVKSVVWYVDKRPATEKEIAIIKQFLPKKAAPKSQGTEKKVLWRVIKTSSVKRMVFNGQIYQII